MLALSRLTMALRPRVVSEGRSKSCSREDEVYREEEGDQSCRPSMTPMTLYWTS